MSRLWFVGYTLAAGILMSVFVLTSGLFRHVFSLGAVVVGIQFFKRWEEKKPRIWFVVLVVLGALFFPLFYILIAVSNGWYVDPSYLG